MDNGISNPDNMTIDCGFIVQKPIPAGIDAFANTNEGSEDVINDGTGQAIDNYNDNLVAAWNLDGDDIGEPIQPIKVAGPKKQERDMNTLGVREIEL